MTMNQLVKKIGSYRKRRTACYSKGEKDNTTDCQKSRFGNEQTTSCTRWKNDATTTIDHSYFQPSQYDNVIHQWRQRPFVRRKFSCFLNRPVAFKIVMNQTRKQIAHARANDDDNEQLILSDMVSSKSANVLFSISSTARLDPSEVTYLNGYYVSRVFHGDEEQLSEWANEMHDWVEESFDQFVNPEEMFLYSPQRPCKEDGSTKYVVFFVQIH